MAFKNQDSTASEELTDESELQHWYDLLRVTLPQLQTEPELLQDYLDKYKSMFEFIRSNNTRVFYDEDIYRIFLQYILHHVHYFSSNKQLTQALANLQRKYS